MTQRVKDRLELLKLREYRKQRKNEIFDPERLEQMKLQEDKTKAESELFAYAAAAEQPVFYGEELFGFNRMYAHPLGKHRQSFSNAVPDYEKLLQIGLDGIYESVKQNYESADAEGKHFYDAIILTYDAFFDLIERYRIAAQENGCLRLAAALEQVPRKGARDYYEALVSLKAIIFALRLIDAMLLPIGRFDVYMKPYFDASISAGATIPELSELTELFFIDLNIDTDLYYGIQQGDNGQSMVLGGCDKNGEDCFNELSEICLAASEKLELIDPKINLRVTPRTPLSLYERGTRLTKKGLGFPQYTNDDVAIPFLTSCGYELEDARNYALAACWELIIPACGADIPNMDAVNLPLAVEKATRRGLASSQTFEDFMQVVDEELRIQCNEKIQRSKNHYSPSPLFSSLMSPCIERGRDITAGGAKYNNYGFHGAGISTAADSVAAIKELVYEQKSVDKAELLSALESNFEGHQALKEVLLAAPKMGNNDDRADSIASLLMDMCVNALKGHKNKWGGIFRMGTGTALEYISAGEKVGATADSRGAGMNLACNFSPSMQANPRGPLSAIQSFTKHDLSRICNGGPFTIEVHNTVFRNSEGEKKVAALVKTFIDLGGHQIQINSINRERLLNALADPESDPNLIVRVWGWSGYFNELDRIYQDHIIARTEHKM